MIKRFEIDLPKEILDVLIQIALAGLCFFSSVKIIQNHGSTAKISVMNLAAYLIVVCFLIGIYFFINSAIKCIKRYYSESPLEIVFYEDRLEVPSDSKKFMFIPDHETKTIIFETIKKISVKGSPDKGECWVRILYLDERKLKKAKISNSVFKTSAMFKDFIAHLQERHPF